MEISTLFDSIIFRLAIIPILICLARIIDVTIGTLRIIFVSKGMKYLASIMGFFEIIIWLFAIGQIMQNLSNVINYIAYGLGFAIGNFVGIYLEEKFSLGYVLLRVITRKSALKLKNYFRNLGYRFTILDADSDEGPVNIIFLTLKRRNIEIVIKNIKKYNPHAFYTLEDVRTVSSDVIVGYRIKSNRRRLFRIFPKSKKK